MGITPATVLRRRLAGGAQGRSGTGWWRIGEDGWLAQGNCRNNQRRLVAEEGGGGGGEVSGKFAGE